jgi:hypothetical protein
MVSSTAAGGVVRALADGSLLQRSCALFSILQVYAWQYCQALTMQA